MAGPGPIKRCRRVWAGGAGPLLTCYINFKDRLPALVPRTLILYVPRVLAHQCTAPA